MAVYITWVYVWGVSSFVCGLFVYVIYICHLFIHDLLMWKLSEENKLTPHVRTNRHNSTLIDSPVTIVLLYWSCVATFRQLLEDTVMASM